MTKRIKPVGKSILIVPLPKENEQSEGGLIIVDNTLTKGKVMEVSAEFDETYKKGDIVIFPEGAGIHQYYRNQNCLWLVATGYPDGHIVGIISDEKEG